MYICDNCKQECETAIVVTPEKDDIGHYETKELLSSCCKSEIIVDRMAATDAIFEAIRSGKAAYGKPADELLDYVLDAIINTTEGRELAERCFDMKCVRDMCEYIAGDYLGVYP